MKQIAVNLLLVIGGALLVWLGSDLCGSAIHLRLKGRGAEAIVRSATFTTDPQQLRYVEFSFQTAEGALIEGFGNTHQSVVVGSRLNVIYLPNNPRENMPTDDPKLSPFFGVGMCALGVLLFGGGLLGTRHHFRRKAALKRIQDEPV